MQLNAALRTMGYIPLYASLFHRRECNACLNMTTLIKLFIQEFHT